MTNAAASTVVRRLAAADAAETLTIADAADRPSAFSFLEAEPEMVIREEMKYLVTLKNIADRKVIF
jgi:hypothetical protein